MKAVLKGCAYSIILVIAMTVTAVAGTMEFSKFRIDVPEGWTAKEEDKTISLLAPRKVAAVSIVWDDSDGTPAKELAQAMSAQLKGTKPVADDGGYSFSFKNKSGVKSKSLLFAGQKEFVMLTVTGDHPQLGDILQSLKAR